MNRDTGVVCRISPVCVLLYLLEHVCGFTMAGASRGLGCLTWSEIKI